MRDRSCKRVGDGRHARHCVQCCGHFGTQRSPNFLKNQRWYPTVYDLRRGAQRRLPHFAFEYGDGGAGDDTGIKHNWSALDAIEMVPRYGVMPELPPVKVELFGREYAAPLGVAPMGSPIVVWPGADKLFAQGGAARRACLTRSGAPAAPPSRRSPKIAPDCSGSSSIASRKNDHAIGFELVRRAEAAGVHVLMLTLDVPVRTIRAREVKVGVGGGGEFKPDWRMMLGMVKCPSWAVAMLQNGQPRFANIQPYAGPNAGLNETISFARKEMGGAFSWDEVARYRDKWKKPLVVKGILHPADAEKAVSLGVDGIWCRTTAAARSRRCRRRSIACRLSSRRSADAPPCCSTAACAAAPTSRARWRSAPMRRSPARRSSGASVRSEPRGRGTSIDL